MSEVSDTVDLVTQLENALQKPFLIEAPEGRTFAARPKMDNHGNVEWMLADITSANKADVLMPKHVTQAVQLQTVDSLCAYINRFKNADTALFADISTSTIVGIVDYHKQPAILANATRPIEEGVPATAENDDVPTARLRAHTATLVLPKSIEWSIWTGVDGKLMSHVDFASFLEENDVDILPLGTMKDGQGNQVEDAPTNIYELIREMQVKSAFGASSVVRNGDYVSVEMQKGDDITTKRNVALPLSIDLAIPVYFGEAPVPMKALMRRRVEDGSLRLGIKLVRPEQVRQDEFKRIVGEIEADVMLPTLYGKA